MLDDVVHVGEVCESKRSDVFKMPDIYCGVVCFALFYCLLNLCYCGGLLLAKLYIFCQRLCQCCVCDHIVCRSVPSIY